MSIYTTLTDILDGVVATFEAANVTLPDKQYVATGQVAHDCEQVTVSFIQMYLGPPGQQSEQPQRCDAPRTIVVEVQIARQLPSLEPRTSSPSVTSMNTMTEAQMQDAELLMDAALGAIDGWAGVLADVSVTNPSGLFQAVVLNLVTAVT